MTVKSNQELSEAIAGRAQAVNFNTRPAELVTRALERGEGRLSAHGAFCATTGEHTGRSPRDKFIVEDDLTRNLIWWENTAAIGADKFDILLEDFLAAIEGRELFAQQLFSGADVQHQFDVEVYTETAWHALFIRNLLIRPSHMGLDDFVPTVTIISLPSFKADPERHGVNSETVIALDLSRNIVLIGGTAYAGEIKKSVFSLFNFHAPGNGVLPMHCSANIGNEGETTLFFGLSGTGKTTLSTDPERVLIGDDEHGWTETGVFNLEGGCYAKTAHLSRKSEPEIFAATERFGTVLENVILDETTDEPDFENLTLTENTRAAYPLYALEHASRSGSGPTPRHVILLTADAFGVLPPIARLTPDQAIYHFLSGYTAKVAGTERGVTEPEATFSACFGAPFMSLHPTVYGRMLKKRLHDSLAECWLINTGWTGGPYGVGERISIAATRRILREAMEGNLTHAEMRVDPVFGFAVPRQIEGIDPALLDPRANWADPEAYDRQAEKLVGLFETNFARFSAADTAIAEAGPLHKAAAE